MIGSEMNELIEQETEVGIETKKRALRRGYRRRAIARAMDKLRPFIRSSDLKVIAAKRADHMACPCDLCSPPLRRWYGPPHSERRRALREFDLDE
jgi:hypothetical protein